VDNHRPDKFSPDAHTQRDDVGLSAHIARSSSTLTVMGLQVEIDEGQRDLVGPPLDNKHCDCEVDVSFVG
jgi:hypothetical protein